MVRRGLARDCPGSAVGAMVRLKSKLLPTARRLGERTPCPGIVGRAESRARDGD